MLLTLPTLLKQVSDCVYEQLYSSADICFMLLTYYAKASPTVCSLRGPYAASIYICSVSTKRPKPGVR